MRQGESVNDPVESGLRPSCRPPVISRGELIRDHMREGTRFVTRTLELRKPVAFCLAMTYSAQCSIIAVATGMILGGGYRPSCVLVIASAVATVVATWKLAKVYDAALRPIPSVERPADEGEGGVAP